MKLVPYRTTCRNCGREVQTRAKVSANAVRIRCARCGTTNFASRIETEDTDA